MDEELVIRGIYQHFKGVDKLYMVLGLAIDSENPQRKLVIYKQLYEGEYPTGTVWTNRTLENFLGDVKIAGKLIKRFTLKSDLELAEIVLETARKKLTSERDELYKNYSQTSPKCVDPLEGRC